MLFLSVTSPTIAHYCSYLFTSPVRSSMISGNGQFSIATSYNYFQLESLIIAVALVLIINKYSTVSAHYVPIVPLSPDSS